MKRSRKAIPHQTGPVEFSAAPYDGPIAVKQRLRNLIELAIAVGRKQGLLGTHAAAGTENPPRTASSGPAAGDDNRIRLETDQRLVK